MHGAQIALRKHVHDRLAFVADGEGAVAGGHDDFVDGQAEAPADGGKEVLRAGLLVGHRHAFLVAGAVDEAAFDTATGEQSGEDLRMVVASAIAVDFGATTEFGTEHDEGAFEQAALLEVFEQRGERLVELGAVFIKAVVDVAVEEKLREAMRTGSVQPLTGRDLLEAIKRQKPTVRDWFETARNHALYANQSGLYDDILAHLNIKK